MRTRQRSKTISLPAPVGGLNSRDALSEMDVKDAVVMENWWPTTTDLHVRKGYLDWATGLSGEATTLLDYPALSGVGKLFAATSTGMIYDVTLSGAVGAALVSGLTSGRFQQTIFTNAGGEFLIAVNGVDAMYRFDGTSWTAVTTAITGLATTAISAVTQYKNRLWFVEKTSMNAWYLPTDAIAGAAVKFPLGSVFSEGGYLVAICTWTIDSGMGVDDQIVFISSEGEVLVYRGLDPASATTWALVGLYKVARPVGGASCAIKYMGDVYILTEYGVIPMSNSLLTAQITTKADITDKILPSMQEAIAAYRAGVSWQMVTFPSANMFVLNVPSGSGNYQFAMNTITGAWAKFTGMPAKCFKTFGNDLFFGATGKVCKAWAALGDAGVSITASVIQAFSAFGNETRGKEFKLCRPIFYSSGSPSILLDVNFDYDTTTLPAGSLSFQTPVSGMVWGGMVWGSMVWGGKLVRNAEWVSAGGIGYTAALSLTVANNQTELRWAATDFLFEPGGVL